jgi:hypothetical protein
MLPRPNPAGILHRSQPSRHMEVPAWAGNTGLGALRPEGDPGLLEMPAWADLADAAACPGWKAPAWPDTGRAGLGKTPAWRPSRGAESRPSRVGSRGCRPAQPGERRRPSRGRCCGAPGRPTQGNRPGGLLRTGTPGKKAQEAQPG